jgi:hypothetical protein
VASLLAGKPLDEIPDGAFELLKTVLAKVNDHALKSAVLFLADLPAPAAEFFRQEHFKDAWENIMKNLPRRQGAAVKAFHEWFDGLKTLRFLHQNRCFSVDF